MKFIYSYEKAYLNDVLFIIVRERITRVACMIDGKRLRELREAHNYSREQFAEKIDLGVSQLWRYERGESDATADVLARIASALGTTADYLIGLTDNPLPNYDNNGLQPDEVALLSARRRGDFREAIKLLVPDD